MSREAFYYEMNADFECISDCIKNRLYRSCKNSDRKEYEDFMNLYVEIKDFIDAEHIDETTIMGFHGRRR